MICILSQRCINWEGMITADIWKPMLEEALDRLSDESEALLTARTDKPVLFRLCTLLDPENPKAVRSFLTKLKDGMGASSKHGLEFKQALAGMMWWSDWYSSVVTLLGNQVEAAAVDMEDNNPLAVAARFPPSDQAVISKMDQPTT
jgi:hypothetical protein